MRPALPCFNSLHGALLVLDRSHANSFVSAPFPCTPESAPPSTQQGGLQKFGDPDLVVFSFHHMEAGEQGVGSEGLKFQASSSQGPCPVNMLINTEEQDIWNGSVLFGNNSRRRTLVGESSQMAVMQSVHRIKRQNCGNTVQGHHDLILGSKDQVGSGPSITNVEAKGNISLFPGPMLGGFQGFMDQDNRKLNARNFQTGSEEAGSSSSSGFSSNGESALTESYWSTMLPGSAGETPQFSVSGSMGSFMSNPHPHLGNGSRSYCKRKISMDGGTMPMGSLTFRASSGQRETDFARFTEGAGTSRSDTANPTSFDSISASMIPVWDEPRYPRDTNAMYQSLRANSVHYTQSGSSNRYRGRHLLGPHELCQNPPIIQNSRVTSATLPSQTWMPRRMVTNESMTEAAGNIDVGLPETSPFSQSNGSSAAVTWRGNNTFLGESCSHPSFVGTPRDFNSGTCLGNHARHHSNGASNWIGIPPAADCRMQNTFEPSGRVISGMMRRSVPFRESASHASQLAPNPYEYPGSVASWSSAHSPAVPSGRRNSFHSQGVLLPFPPASCATSNNMILGPQAAFGDTYPSFTSLHGPAMTPFFPAYGDSGRASPMQNLHHMPFRRQQVLPTRGINHQRSASHELLDESLVYNGVDIHDQHSNMRLDVDNMSYEELLALEERIGNVNTGLSEDKIQMCLKMSKQSFFDATLAVVSQESEIKCSICQEEYVEDDELGQLDCGHSYHTACIKQWLLQKNQCPICKAAAYSES